MKPKFNIQLSKTRGIAFSSIPAIILMAASAHALEIEKAASGTELTDGASWTGDTAPGTDDVASWIAGSLRSGLTLGAETTWSGIKVRGAGGITIPAGNALNLGAAGLDVSIGGGSSFNIGNTLNVTSDQNWIIATSTGLGFNSGSALTGSSTITLTGAGYMNTRASMTGFSGVLDYGLGSRLEVQGSHGTWSNVALIMTSGVAFGSNGLNGTQTLGSLASANASSSIGGGSQNGSVTYQVGALNQTTTFAGRILNGTNGGTRTTSFSKTGNGVLTLTHGESNYTGTTTISAGAIKLASATAISSSSAVTINSNNGLQFGTGVTAVTLNDLGGTGELALINDDTDPVVITANNATAKTLNGIISGDGALIKNGAGTLTLGKINTFTGGVTLNEGRINLNSGSGIGTLGSGTTTLGVVAGPAVILDQSYRSISNPLLVNGEATILYIDNRFDNNSTLSGGGTLTINGSQATTSSVNLGIGSMTAFTGTLNIIGGNFRKRTGSGSAAGAIVNIDGTETSKAQYSRFDYVGTDQIGALSGNQYAILSGGNGTMTYEIGARNLDTTFAGLIRDGSDVGNPRLVSLTKVGTGKLTLSGTNTYTGDTRVLDGVLAVTGTSIDDNNKVILDGGTMEITGEETVDTLFFGSEQQAAGTWGSEDSDADNKDSTRFSGTGVLNVVTEPVPVTGFESWIAGYGLAEEDQGPSIDADKDGLNNLLEYVLGGDPSLNDAAAITPQGGPSGSNYVFSFVRSDVSEADTTQTVEYGDDLEVWGSIPIGASPGVEPVAIVEDSPNADFDTVTVTIPTAGATKFFARLKVVK
jgi:autotransporter-associated beta strand protein